MAPNSLFARLLLRGRLAFFAGPAAALTGVGTFRFLAGAGHERGLGASFRVFQRSYRSRGVRDVQRPLSTFRRAYLAYANTENPPGVSLCCQTRPRLSHYLPPMSPVASSRAPGHETPRRMLAHGRRHNRARTTPADTLNTPAGRALFSNCSPCTLETVGYHLERNFRSLPSPPARIRMFLRLTVGKNQTNRFRIRPSGSHRMPAHFSNHCCGSIAAASSRSHNVIKPGAQFSDSLVDVHGTNLADPLPDQVSGCHSR